MLQVEPTQSALVTVTAYEWSNEPPVRLHHYLDLYGNHCQRVILPFGRSTLRFDAHVLNPDAYEEADEDAPQLSPDLVRRLPG